MHIKNQTFKAHNCGVFCAFSFCLSTLIAKVVVYVCAVQISPVWSCCRVGEGRACWSLGNAHTALGNHETALDFAQKHLEISKEVSVRTNSSTVFHLRFRLQVTRRRSLTLEIRISSLCVFFFPCLFSSSSLLFFVISSFKRALKL